MSDDLTNLNQYRAAKRQQLMEKAHKEGMAFGFQLWPLEHYTEMLGYTPRGDGGPFCILLMHDDLKGEIMTPADVRSYAKELLELADKAECEVCNPQESSEDAPVCPKHPRKEVSEKGPQPTAPARTCTTCRHHEMLPEKTLLTVYGSLPLTERSACGVEGIIDPVDGNRRYRRCDYQRSAQGKCGPDGKLWQQGET